jgi:lysophospholipase L1-like esterase
LNDEINTMLRPRYEQLNDVVRAVSRRHGVLVVELADDPTGRDPAIWSKDLMHTNMRGHAVAAEAVLTCLGGHTTVTSVSEETV